ncbi:MAG: hypothetical protein JSW28_04110, partial [Thermoplasmata archaeon]
MRLIDLMAIYSRLSDHFGQGKWWPAESRFEVMVGAILTQQTTWRNVARAIENLKDRRLLSVDALAAAPPEIIEECVRPSGFFRQKADRIKRLAEHLLAGYKGDLNVFFERDLGIIRNELLSFSGIGQETADSILLYAGDKPKFVVDAYTFRIFSRLGMDFNRKYEEAQKFFEDRVQPDVKVYKN